MKESNISCLYELRVTGDTDENDTSIRCFNSIREALGCREFEYAKEYLSSIINDDSNASKYNWIKQTNDYRETVWHILCRTYIQDYDEEKLILDIASILLSISSEEDFYLKDGCDNTPFHNLFHWHTPHHLALVELILNHCRSQNLLQDLLVFQRCKKGNTPLHRLASRAKRDLEILPPSLCNKILKDCCDTSSSLLPQVVKNERLETPLHWAAKALVSSPNCDLNGNCNLDNNYLLLQLWIKYSPSALIIYDADGFLPIDRLIEYYVHRQIRHSFVEEPNTNCDFYYCAANKLRLTADAEHKIHRHLWPKMLMLLKTTFQVIMSEYKDHRQPNESASGSMEKVEEEIESMSGVHFAAACQFLPVSVLICANMDNPKAVSEKTSEQGMLPLHFASSTIKMKTKVVKKSSSYLNLALSQWNNYENDSNSSYASSLESSKSKRYICSQSMIQYLLSLDKEASKVWTKSGQLPLHLACSHGKSWKDIQFLLKALPEATSHADKPSRLYPFMLAAVKHNNILDVVYELLLFNPDVISICTKNQIGLSCHSN